ncbi:VapC toxin family PIN domain ribonuclease [Caulobacter radicis]|uniref:type II toxin-antitoxin system VapC family toxin n=1 Tax=Caulobacter radicis TaxID=2172650 RepID=UPI000D56385F|nr:type II toxin-antitoxin system VapC family toxin [Caulobacter radicis]PVM91208.1 VapC toxin family PIN domain ribonuclease [Caulobacter radicis]
MFVDASAFCAILLGEPEKQVFELRLTAASGAVTSAVAIWETVRSLVRAKGLDVADAELEVLSYVGAAEISVVEIGSREGSLALDAFARFGKGVHPAKLNMGDCFAYACAKAHGVPLLYKGGDFALTDIEAA